MHLTDLWAFNLSLDMFKLLRLKCQAASRNNRDAADSSVPSIIVIQTIELLQEVDNKDSYLILV